MEATNDLDRRGECATTLGGLPMPQRSVTNTFLDHIWDPEISKLVDFAYLECILHWIYEGNPLSQLQLLFRGVAGFCHGRIWGCHGVCRVC